MLPSRPRTSPSQTKHDRGWGKRGMRYPASEELEIILDDFSRYVIAGKLCTTMKAEDVTGTLRLALIASGCDQARIIHKPRLLSDDGSSYLLREDDRAHILEIDPKTGTSRPFGTGIAPMQRHWHSATALDARAKKRQSVYASAHNDEITFSRIRRRLIDSEAALLLALWY